MELKSQSIYPHSAWSLCLCVLLDFLRCRLLVLACDECTIGAATRSAVSPRRHRPIVFTNFLFNWTLSSLSQENCRSPSTQHKDFSRIKPINLKGLIKNNQSQTLTIDADRSIVVLLRKNCTAAKRKAQIALTLAFNQSALELSSFGFGF